MASPFLLTARSWGSSASALAMAEAASRPSEPPLHASAAATEETVQQLKLMQTLLNKKLGPEFVQTRQGAGQSKVSYIEGWRAMSLANEVFGFNGWHSEIKSLEVDFIDHCVESGRYAVGVSAIIRIWLRDGCTREDVGYGKCENSKSKADALEKAKKEAVTDANKRVLRTFGNLLGNCMYDKDFLKEVAKMKAPKPTLDFKNLHRGGDLYPEGMHAPVPGPSTSTPVAVSKQGAQAKSVLPPAAQPVPKPVHHDATSNRPQAVPRAGPAPAPAPAPPVEEPPRASSPEYDVVFEDAFDDSLLDAVELDAESYPQQLGDMSVETNNSDSGFFEAPKPAPPKPAAVPTPTTPGLNRNVSRPIRRSDLTGGAIPGEGQSTIGSIGGPLKSIAPPELGGFGSARGLKRNASAAEGDDDKENTTSRAQTKPASASGRTPLGEISMPEPPAAKRARAPPA